MKDNKIQERLKSYDSKLFSDNKNMDITDNWRTRLQSATIVK